MFENKPAGDLNFERMCGINELETVDTKPADMKSFSTVYPAGGIAATYAASPLIACCGAVAAFVPGLIGVIIVMVAFIIATPAAVFDLKRVRGHIAKESAEDNTYFMEHQRLRTIKYKILHKTDILRQLRIVHNLLIVVLVIYVTGVLVFLGLVIAFAVRLNEANEQ